MYISTRTATITINGTKTTISDIPAIRNTGGVTTKLGSATKTIEHTSDGSKSIKISATFDMKATLSGTYYGTMSTSKTVDLDKLDRTKPTVSVKFNSATANSVKLTATANKTCDNWQYSTNDGSSWTSFGSEGTSNTFTISNLSAGTAYSVVVRARKTSNNVTSSKSSAVTATTKPKAPGGPGITGITQTSAKASWNAVTGAKSYKVYLGDTLKASGLTTRSYTFTGLTANTSYSFKVVATGTSGDSAKSSAFSFTTLPNVPTGLKVTDQTDSSVSLSWSYNNGGGAKTTSFDVYRDDKFLKNVTTTNCTDNTYENTNSSYTVLASTSAGKSAKSTPVSVPFIPLSVTLSAVNNSTYATITPSFSGGLNKEINFGSLRWAYGSKNADYFAENGYSFTNNFVAIQNGTYTVYAKDTSGNSAVGTIVISGIYTKSTMGAYTQTFTDLSVDSIGLPISFERTYNSMDTENNIFGNGWSLNYAKTTLLSDDGTVQLVYLPDGTINYFSVSDSTYTGIQTQNRLVADGSKLILTTTDNTKYTYENNYLTRIEDANGNTTVIELNTENLPVKITDSVGREYIIAYSNNKITSITDPAGRAFAYVYDESGNLAEHKTAGGTIVNKFVYTNGLLTKITDSLDNDVYEITYTDFNRVNTITDIEEETTTYYAYRIANNGELTVYEDNSEIKLNIADVSNNPPSNTYNPYDQVIVDSDGNCYTYNSDGTVSGVNIEDTVTNSGDYEKVVYTYDTNGNVTHIVTTDKNDKLLEDVTYTYTYFENSSNISSCTEVTVTYNYNEETGELSSTDTGTIISAYDIKGNLLSERTVQGEDDNTVSYTYNENGLMLSETDVETVTEYTYDANGFITNKRLQAFQRCSWCINRKCR